MHNSPTQTVLTCRVVTWAQPTDIYVIGRLTVNDTGYSFESGTPTDPLFITVRRICYIVRLVFVAVNISRVVRFAGNSQRLKYGQSGDIWKALACTGALETKTGAHFVTILFPTCRHEILDT